MRWIICFSSADKPMQRFDTWLAVLMTPCITRWDKFTHFGSKCVVTLRSGRLLIGCYSNPGKLVNETLFLVKYAFFSHTVQPGPGHKADITKASRYAKLINKALDRHIQPAHFVAFARAEKIQSRGRR